MPLKSKRIGNRDDNLLKNAQEKLGLYVYVLIDPRTQQIFYIGRGGDAKDRGGNDRVLSHFREAATYASGGNPDQASRKVLRILEIWNSGLDVVWWIVRRDILCPAICKQIEATLIDAFSVTGTPTLNAVKGYGSSESGLLSSQDVMLLNPPKINPKRSYKTVFMFPINQLYGDRENLYEATRKYWNVTEEWRSQQGAIALGINSMTSAAAFEVKSWRRAGGKFAFTGVDVTDKSELARCSVAKIIGRTLGYWQRGSFLIVEFDGDGHFRFLRGSKSNRYFAL